MQATSNSATAHVHQLQTALIRRNEVQRLTALSRSRIYALMATGDFPKPVTLGSMSVAWLEIEVREWIATRIAECRKPDDQNSSAVTTCDRKALIAEKRKARARIADSRKTE